MVCSIPPARNSHKRCESLLEKLTETQHPEFSMGTGHAGTSALHGPRFQTLGEQVLSITVCANSLSLGKHSYQRTVKTILKFKFPNASQRPTCNLAFLRTAASDLLNYDFLHRSLKWET